MNNKTKLKFEADIDIIINQNRKGIKFYFDIETNSNDLEPELNLTYDDVEFALLDEFDTMFSNEIEYDINSIFIIKNGEKYPVIANENKSHMQMLRDINYHGKYLSLPYAKYEISKEYKLYSALCNYGILSEKDDEFDFKLMSNIINDISDFKEIDKEFCLK